MTDPVWPDTLPQRLLNRGLSVQVGYPVVRSETDGGVAKVRRRFTRGIETVSGILVLTAAQMAAFRTFYQDSLSAGARAFTWTHPETDATVLMRMTAAPSISLENLPLYEVALSLEVLP
jgi:hypothetical protein